jgi:hypothetical protein
MSNYLFNKTRIHNTYDKCYVNKKNNDFAKYIHNNIRNMTLEEMKYMAHKVLDYPDIIKILYTYDMHNYEYKNNDISLKDLANKIHHILKHYQYKSGGNYIEDIQWNVNKHSDNDVYFINTIQKKHVCETKQYISDIVHKISNISDKYEITCKIKENKKKHICWIIIHVYVKGT